MIGPTRGDLSGGQLLIGAHAKALELAGASPIAMPRLRLNAVCPYYTMFPLAFPLAALSDAEENAAVLDPFCGRGTTAYAARLLGLRATGIDADAVAVAIARAKLATGTAAQVEARCAELLEATPEPASVPAGEFWELAFHVATLKELCRLREALMDADSEVDVLLRALVLGILHGPQSVRQPNYLSNQMPRTYATKPKPAVAYWKRHGLAPRRVELRAAVSRRARYLLKEVPAGVTGEIVKGDSREIGSLGLGTAYSHVVTSPPYAGMRTYRPDQWLRHWFLGGPPGVDYGIDGMLPPALATFAAELATVWNGAAAACRPGATLTVRFGALPSVRVDAEALLRESLEGTPWRTESVASAGASTRGRRQAGHMRRAGVANEEIDLRAILAS